MQQYKQINEKKANCNRLLIYFKKEQLSIKITSYGYSLINLINTCQKKHKLK